MGRFGPTAPHPCLARHGLDQQAARGRHSARVLARRLARRSRRRQPHTRRGAVALRHGRRVERRHRAAALEGAQQGRLGEQRFVLAGRLDARRSSGDQPGDALRPSDRSGDPNRASGGADGARVGRVQPARLARDWRLVRDRPALESLLGTRGGQADAGRSRSCRQHHVQPEWLDVRDDRRLGRPRKALDDCNAPTGGERAGGSKRNLESRGLHPRRQTIWSSSTTTGRGMSGRPRWAPGSGEHVPSPAGT